MAKKTVQLQLEVENEEDWEKLVDRTGLIVVDVYSDWCGPCSGMMGTLRKVKLEYGGDLLTLAAAKCDNIECLRRFRRKSEPTWMFISNRKVIKLMFGTNSPQLMTAMITEINKEKNNVPRPGIEYDELTDEEQERADRDEQIRKEEKRMKEEAEERAAYERREAIIDNLIEPLVEYNFVLISHHIKTDGVNQICDELRLSGMSLCGRAGRHLLTEEQFNEMMYYSTWEIAEEEVKVLLSREVTTILLQAPMGVEFEPVIDVIQKKVYGQSKCPPGDEDCLAVKYSTIIKVPKSKETPEDAGGGEPQTIVDMLEEEEIDVIIPGCYTVENEKCKIMAMRFLYPHITGKYDIPEPEPIPPHLLIAFDMAKREDVYPLMEEYPDETLSYGFFSSCLPETAELIARTRDKFERTFTRPLDTKLVIKVAKKKSEPLLSYSMLGPCYVSSDTTEGEKECAVFFPEGYNEVEEEEVEEEWVKPDDLPDYKDEEEVEEEEIIIEDEEEEEEQDDDIMALIDVPTTPVEASPAEAPPAEAPPAQASPE